MYKCLTFFLFSVFASDFATSAFPHETAPQNAYQQGVEYQKSGDWVKALETWLTARHDLEQQQRSDPRIGIAFIELVAEKQARQYYDLACDFYYWGFSQSDFRPYKKAVEAEVERIAPLLRENEHKAWRDLLDRDSPVLMQKITSFWRAKDPTPSTVRNERLLEHWQRIAYARAHFDKAKTTPYGTDDRGLIYVKYGAPDRISRGILGSNRSQFKVWTSIVLDNSPNSFGDAQAGALQQTLLMEQLNQLNRTPEYELWFYHSFNLEEAVFFLFGQEEGHGFYGLQDGVEDLIPRRAFYRHSAQKTDGILPGAILQSVYYSELLHLHPFFEERFAELQYIWDRFESSGGRTLAQSNATFRGKRQHFETLDRHDPLRAQAPPETSDFEETTSEVQVALYPFRFLGPDEQPRVAVIVRSHAKLKPLVADLTADPAGPGYALTHTLTVHDADGARVRTQHDNIPADSESLSTFLLLHEQAYREYRAFSELFTEVHNETQFDSLGRERSVPQLLGVGKSHTPAAPPLRRATDKLELSDLLIGVSAKLEGGQRLPFPVVPADEILASEPLKVYLEIYHLHIDSDGLARFNIDCKVAGLADKKEASVSLSFDFEAANRTSKEAFEIDVSELQPGAYELQVTVRDRVSQHKKTRTASFEVISQTSLEGHKDN